MNTTSIYDQHSTQYGQPFSPENIPPFYSFIPAAPSGCGQIIETFIPAAPSGCGQIIENVCIPSCLD